MTPKIHTLANGATVLITSPGHGFKFSDGTVAEAQHKEVCDALTLERVSLQVGGIRGMPLNETKMVMSREQRDYLYNLCPLADIVIVPLPVLLALRECGGEVRHTFGNVVATNATTETQRSAPADKIVDINNWSY